MVRGRKPRPTALKLIAGERPDRINDDEPIPDDSVPVCPVKDILVNQVWDYTVTQLKRMRVITLADRDILLAYCQAVVMHQRASELLDEEGYLWRAPNGDLKPNPAVRMQKEAGLMVKALGIEFGLTPAARTRIRVGDQSPAKETEQGASRLLSS